MTALRPKHWLCGVSMKISVPDRLAERVAALAQAQGREIDEVAAELIESALPLDPEVEARARAKFRFVGTGNGGRSDTSITYKQHRREPSAQRTASDL